MNIPTDVVPAAYEMDPATEDLLFDGTELRDGMVVLIDNDFSRTPYEKDEDVKNIRLREVARWCEVHNLRTRTTRRSDTGDAMTFVEFIGVYGDGVKAKRSYGVHNAWLVKKDSLPVTAA